MKKEMRIATACNINLKNLINLWWFDFFPCFSKISENMTAMKPLISNILCLKNIPVLLEKSYEKEAIVMSHHPYKEI